MKKTLSLLLFLVLLADKVFSVSEDTTLTLLNNRIVCTLPKGFTEFSNKNLMGPQTSREKEQYLKITDGAAEMTMYAIELFVRTSKNTEYEVKEHVKTWKNKEVTYSISEKIKNSEQNFTKYIITPNKIVEAANTLYYSVFIDNFDNTLISIGFYLNKSAIENQEKWKEVINKIIKSIAPGSRKLSSDQEVIMQTVGEKILKLKLTKDYGILLEKGDDMFVANIMQISSLSDMPSKLTIYSGMHPQEFFKEQGIERNDVTLKKINIGSEELEFDTFTDDKVWLGECVYEMDKNSYLHFILVCYNQRVFSEMFEMLEKGELRSRE